jgi:magnesium transporter
VGIGELLLGTRTGLLIGMVLGWCSYHLGRICEPAVSLQCLSLIFAAAAAAGLGLAFPWALQSLGKDPAYGSGPIATVTQDILTLLIYFTVVHLTFG